ncbi:hypothetical protein J4G65_10335 [Aeromonas allosaccharophila]|uniref:hypothetical protein n=1 Tax=Aeromonas allosaccharophila TaxID=656 RepID=UPI001BCCD35E|nr:hypothetical protein [Aeromonas allosaccharophila]MBS4695868.1 hypothetical protein [Aeromonas allosaccharophila]
MIIRFYKTIYFLFFMMVMSPSFASNLSKVIVVSGEGEHLTSIFNRVGLSTATLYNLLDSDEKNSLARFETGSEIELFVDDSNDLKKINVIYKGKLISSFSKIIKNNKSFYVSSIKDSSKKTKSSNAFHQNKSDVNSYSNVNNFLAKNPKAKKTLVNPTSVSKCIAGNIISAALLDNNVDKDKVLSLTAKISKLAQTVQGGNSKIVINDITNSYVDLYSYNEKALLDDLKINECANLNTSVWNAQLP